MANEYLTVEQAQYLLSKYKVTVDTTLDTSSGNAVSNSAVANALAGMQNDPVDVSDSASASSGSDTTICLTAQYGAGVYLVSAYASFPNNSTGRRHIHLSTTNTGSAVDDWSQITGPPNSGAATVLQLTTILKRTSTGRWYLRVYQNSGSAQTVSGGIRVLKLH